MKLKPLGPNQTQVERNGTVILFSYETPVAVNYNGAFYRTSKHYSKTTTKHINAWLNGAKAETVSQDFIDKLL